MPNQTVCRHCENRDLRIKALEKMLSEISQAYDKVNQDLTETQAKLFSRKDSLGLVTIQFGGINDRCHR